MTAKKESDHFRDLAEDMRDQLADQGHSSKYIEREKKREREREMERERESIEEREREGGGEERQDEAISIYLPFLSSPTPLSSLFIFTGKCLWK